MSLWIIINIIAIQHMACSLIKTKEFNVKGKTTPSKRETETERKTDRETEGKRMRQSEREVERETGRKGQKNKDKCK